MWNSPTFSIPGTVLRMLTTRWPASSRVFRSLPKSLIELAPLTPESASSTLSRINCEKLKLIRGKSLNFSISSSWISSRVIVRVQTLWPKSLTGLFRHCSIGFKGALNSRLKKLVTSVPSSGRPTCDITPLTSGIERDHLAEPGRHPRGLLERHGPRQDRPDPEVSFLERGHELAPQVRDQRRS